jgi:glutamine synthetase
MDCRHFLCGFAQAAQPGYATRPHDNFLSSGIMDEALPASELQDYLRHHPETRFIDAMYVDLNGFVRGKRYPADKAGKLYSSGMQMPEAHYTLDVTGDSVDPCGRGFSDGDPDCAIFPVAGTLAPVPWAEEPRAQLLMQQAPSARPPKFVDPRRILGHVVERFGKTGLKPVMAFELEFYLLDPEPDAAGRPQSPMIPGTNRRLATMQTNSMEELDAFGAFVAEIERTCRAQGIPSSVACTEFATAQYEINLDHVNDPLAAADHAVLQRRAIKAVARRHGMQATFMSKPFLDRNGSGTHLHVSLVDEKGHNVFDDGSALGSPLLRHAIGGMQAALAESMAIFAPNINAFRRYGPNRFVPVNKSWGAQNRSVAFRIPGGPAKARRIEHRAAGADANPYLVAAAVLAAIQHGLENELDPGAPADRRNVSDEVDPDLPFDWMAAVDRLERAPILGQAIDPLYLAIYAACKRGEHERFMSRIFPREYEWYL